MNYEKHEESFPCIAPAIRIIAGRLRAGKKPAEENRIGGGQCA